MKVDMPFKDYLMAVKPHSNEPLVLDTVLRPFGLVTPSGQSPTLLVGHLLDHMLDGTDGDEPVDAIDVARAATELGIKEADGFLDQAPWLMYQMIRLDG